MFNYRLSNNHIFRQRKVYASHSPLFFFMNKILIVSVFCLLLVSIGAAGCIASDPIVGSWYFPGSDSTVVFNNDGTGTMTLTLFDTTSKYPVAWEKEGEKTYKIYPLSEIFGIGASTCIISDDGKYLRSPSTGKVELAKN